MVGPDPTKIRNKKEQRQFRRHIFRTKRHQQQIFSSLEMSNAGGKFYILYLRFFPMLEFEKQPLPAVRLKLLIELTLSHSPYSQHKFSRDMM